MKNLGFVAAALLARSARAQNGVLNDLDTVLKSQSNLSTFYNLIQVCWHALA